MVPPADVPRSRVDRVLEPSEKSSSGALSGRAPARVRAIFPVHLAVATTWLLRYLSRGYSSQQTTQGGRLSLQVARLTRPTDTPTRSQQEEKKGARPRDPKIPHRLSTPDSKRGAPHLSPTPRKEVPASSFRPFPLGGGGFRLEAVRFGIGQRPPVALGSVECQAGGPEDLTYSPSILYG